MRLRAIRAGLLLSQLDLFGDPEPAPRASVPDEQDALLEALKRDLDTLAGPPRVPWPCPEADRPLYEGRIADYRARLRSMVD